MSLTNVTLTFSSTTGSCHCPTWLPRFETGLRLMYHVETGTSFASARHGVDVGDAQLGEYQPRTPVTLQAPTRLLRPRASPRQAEFSSYQLFGGIAIQTGKFTPMHHFVCNGCTRGVRERARSGRARAWVTLLDCQITGYARQTFPKLTNPLRGIVFVIPALWRDLPSGVFNFSRISSHTRKLCPHAPSARGFSQV